MKRALFVVLGEKGHIHPFLGPAQALAARGVDVAFYAPTDVSSALSRLGLRFVGPRSLPVQGQNRGEAFAALVADAGRLERWIRAMLLDSVPDFVEALDAVVAAERPDVLVIDPMAYAAAIVAERRRVPWIGLSTSLNPLFSELPDTPLGRTIGRLAVDRDRLFDHYGVRARFAVCDVLSPGVTGCFSTDALAGDVPAGVALLGPSLPRGARGDEPSFDWGALDPARPLVVMSLGSQIWHQPRMFQAAIEATAALDVTLLASIGTLDLGPLPAHVVTAPYLPQIAALERAAALVTHGGANSIMEALWAGAPMLVSPICNDQHHNAELLARRSAAVVADLATDSVASVRGALEALLSTGRERSAAAHITASYRSADGASAAAALIERCAAGSAE